MEFGKRIGVDQAVLSRWIRREEAGSRPLVRVDVKPRPSVHAPAGTGVEVVVGAERVIHVEAGFDEETLARVLKVLGQC